MFSKIHFNTLYIYSQTSAEKLDIYIFQHFAEYKKSYTAFAIYDFYHCYIIFIYYSAKLIALSLTSAGTSIDFTLLYSAVNVILNSSTLMPIFVS